MRPHLPFNIRPVKDKRVRKSLAPAAIVAAAAETVPAVKAERRPVKVAPERSSPGLKVLGRQSQVCE